MAKDKIIKLSEIYVEDIITDFDKCNNKNLIKKMYYDKLTNTLDKLVNKEDYEKAAKVRDEINKFKNMSDEEIDFPMLYKILISSYRIYIKD